MYRKKKSFENLKTIGLASNGNCWCLKLRPVLRYRVRPAGLLCGRHLFNESYIRLLNDNEKERMLQEAIVV